MTTKKMIVGLLSALLAVAMFVPATADPLPGQILKFQQLPMAGTDVGGQKYYGHDEWSTIYGTRGDAAAAPWHFFSYPDQQGIYMADDFADQFSTPVVHVRWWGSYMQDFLGETGMQQFLISFEADVPAGTNGIPYSHPDPSHPDNLHQVVFKGPLSSNSGTFTETLHTSLPPGMPGESIYEYNAELACPFPQQPDTVYWLKIVALVDPQLDGQIRWGWHNRDYTAQDLLASPVPTPGEHIAGGIVGIDGTTTPIWHFQDNAVQGPLGFVNSQDPTACHVDVWQQLGTPQHYRYPHDGPDGIQEFSKDLAFELYTIPEPSTLAFVGIGILGLLGIGRRRPNV